MTPAGSRAWAIAAHTAAAALLGVLEAVRIDNLRVGLVLVPLFAATGLAAGAVIAASEWLTRGWRRWLAALAIAAPTLAVAIPIAQTVFGGAGAQSLPLAAALSFAAPLVGWLLAAGAVWLGARLSAGDRTSRAIPILGVAGAIGGVVWIERNLVGPGETGAQIGAALAVIVLAGVLIRLMRRVQLSPYIAAAIAGIVLGTASAVVVEGLAAPAEQRAIEARGDHGRDLLRLWGELAARIEAPGDEVAAPAAPAGPAWAGSGSAPAPASTEAPPPPPPRAAEQTLAGEAPAALIDRTRAMNILIISIDSLRFDLLAPGAPHREDFPRIARLLDESVQFTRAIAPGSVSDISIGALLTGLRDPFQELAATLPEALRAGGRRTASVMRTEVAQSIGTMLLERGVELVRRVDTGGDPLADAAKLTTTEALRAIERFAGGPKGAKRAARAARAARAPWFAWVHYADLDARDTPGAVPSTLLLEVNEGASPAVHRYRALLRQIDRQLGRLLDELAAKQLADRTIIWFVGDHGVSLEGDPRMAGTHGGVAYGPLVRVPLAVRIPDVAPGVRTDPVTFVDLAPTILALAGAPHAMPRPDGADLVPAIVDGPAALRPPATRALVVHEELQWSVVEWPHQVIVRPADDLAELYDLERDPLNLKDLSVQQPDLVRRLRARYAEVLPVHVDRSVGGRAARELRALPPAPRATP